MILTLTVGFEFIVFYWITNIFYLQSARHYLIYLKDDRAHDFPRSDLVYFFSVDTSRSNCPKNGKNIGGFLPSNGDMGSKVMASFFN